MRCKKLEKVTIDTDVDKYFQVGVQLPPREEELLAFLRKNVDMFSWSAYEASGVDQNFICHHLNVNPFIILKKQPPWRSSKEHFGVKEVVVNTVVVKKKSGKWRVCVDFTDLNKTCPKDPFLIPQIDQLVDRTVGHPRMSFLDAFQGYHQIPLALAN